MKRKYKLFLIINERGKIELYREVKIKTCWGEEENNNFNSRRGLKHCFIVTRPLRLSNFHLNGNRIRNFSYLVR
jgi:hypothetical protein